MTSLFFFVHHCSAWKIVIIGPLTCLFDRVHKFIGTTLGRVSIRAIFSMFSIMTNNTFWKQSRNL